MFVFKEVWAGISTKSQFLFHLLVNKSKYRLGNTLPLNLLYSTVLTKQLIFTDTWFNYVYMINVNRYVLCTTIMFERASLCDFQPLAIYVLTTSFLFKGSTVVCSAWSFVFYPATTANDLRLRRIFYPRFCLLHLFFYLNSWERASIFPFECSVLNKGTTGTIVITSLVWRGPWLGIEPGTSRQHYTTRLSRRRFL